VRATEKLKSRDPFTQVDSQSASTGPVSQAETKPKQRLRAIRPLKPRPQPDLGYTWRLETEAGSRQKQAHPTLVAKHTAPPGLSRLLAATWSVTG
jgi:hypothetical protein